MVEMHGGGIAVTSEVGQGSRFTVSFPYFDPVERAEAPQQISSPLEASGDTTPSSHKPLAALPLVLLVEDNEVSISMFADYLQYHKFRVVIARNGYEALERSQEEKPDIILMDSQMPEMDGLEATRRIRANPHLAPIPIIMMTALAMPGDRERCLSAGANEYLSKPINLQEMLNTIKAYLT
jgi:CheY-like chemotaxis protein